MFQPHRALILAYLVSWALLLEGSWLEFYLSEHCGLSELKQVCMTHNVVFLRWYLSGFFIVSFCLCQGTQLDWTKAQLQQIFPVRHFSFLFIWSFLFIRILFASLSHLSSGCHCSGAKRQPVSNNPSPSENSSANASIGSTQSTPTSSMAWDYGNLHHQQSYRLPSKSPIRVLCFCFL